MPPRGYSITFIKRLNTKATPSKALLLRAGESVKISDALWKNLRIDPVGKEEGESSFLRLCLIVINFSGLTLRPCRASGLSFVLADPLLYVLAYKFAEIFHLSGGLIPEIFE